jgi:hypothetical protein
MAILGRPLECSLSALDDKQNHAGQHATGQADRRSKSVKGPCHHSNRCPTTGSDPRLLGKPAEISVKLYVNGEFAGEVRGERPTEAEARIYCVELRLEIDALMNKGRGYVQ